MDLIAALYTLGVLLVALFVLAIIAEVGVWWWGGFAQRVNHAKRRAKRIR